MSFSHKTIEKMLPKTYMRKYVARDIKTTLLYFRDLKPQMGLYVYNSGETKYLMSLTGTIPVTYDGKIYNIPVCVWLEETYPHSCPICYVKPTHEMMVMRSEYLTSNGEVLLPYLDQWTPGECDLVSVVQVMVSMFGLIPPLSMRPRQEPAQASCCLEFHKELEGLSMSDGSSYLSLLTDGGEPFQQSDETSC